MDRCKGAFYEGPGEGEDEGPDDEDLYGEEGDD